MKTPALSTWSQSISMAPALSTWSEALRAERRMGRRPLDRRCFRDACAAARSQLRLPEGVPQEADLGELIVCRLAYS